MGIRAAGLYGHARATVALRGGLRLDVLRQCIGMGMMASSRRPVFNGAVD